MPAFNAPDLPDGQINARVQQIKVQPLLQKYSVFPKSQISLYLLPIPPHKRGASRSSRTLMRDAMDAAVSHDE